MDQNILGNMLMTYVEVAYKGGVQQFLEDGGLISTVPFGDNSALIYLKDPPEYFVEAIEELNERNNWQIKFASDLNFDGEEIADVLKDLADVLKDLAERFSLNQILVNPGNRLVLYITIPGVSMSEEEISEVTSILIARMPSLVRGVLIVNNEPYPFDNSGVGMIVKVEKETIREPISNDKTITEDSITDLKIALGRAETVEDFLNMI